MKNDQVQPLNYCAHAIEDMRELETILRGAAPESARVFRRLIDMLKHSVKFILPNCCDLIDPSELRQAHLDLTRLPFPCVAFEAPWEKEDGIEQLGEFQQTPATKRIALCWEASPEYELLPGLNSILDAFPEGGVFVLPIYWGPEHRRWTVALGGSFVPYENTMQDMKLEESLPASRIAHAATIEAGLTKSKAKHFRAEPFYLLPEFYEKTLAAYGGNREKAYAQIILDSRDEVQTVVQACSVINCANVTTAEVSAPAALNKKRQEKGKQPFFSYKVLQLSDERREAGKGGAGGNHASPRMLLFSEDDCTKFQYPTSQHQWCVCLARRRLFG
ncbi:hypothetical protein [Pseudomonas monteilii]|jgi:hypothetical protein|uniref:hypothetical protein n=1 Tax=Pseudomonas monteilii TaxID=76759 RepID=UPI000B264C64|nr:hypothetical protein [Pseudomonas monteilii]